MGQKLLIVVSDSGALCAVHEHFSHKIPKGIEIITQEDAKKRGLHSDIIIKRMGIKEAVYALGKEYDLQYSDNLMKEEHENIAENKREMKIKALTDNRFAKRRYMPVKNPKRNLRSKRM